MEKKEEAIPNIERTDGSTGKLLIFLGLMGLGLMVARCTVALFTPSKDQVWYEKSANDLREKFNLPPKIKIEFGERDSIKTYKQGLRGREWTINGWLYARWIDPETKKYQTVRCRVSDLFYTTTDLGGIYDCKKVDRFVPRR